MYCRKCGTQLPDDALFCNSCGERQQTDNDNSSTNASNSSSNRGFLFQKKVIIGSITSFIVAAVGTVSIFFPNLFNLEKKSIKQLSIEINNANDAGILFEFLKVNTNRIVDIDISYSPSVYKEFQDQASDDSLDQIKSYFHNSRVYVLKEDYNKKGHFSLVNTTLDSLYGGPYDIIPHCEKALKREGACLVELSHSDGYYFSHGLTYYDFATKQELPVDITGWEGMGWARAEQGAHPIEYLKKCHIDDIECQTLCLSHTVYDCGEYPQYPLHAFLNHSMENSPPYNETILFGLNNNYSAVHKNALYKNGKFEIIDQGTINFIRNSSNKDVPTYLIDNSGNLDKCMVISNNFNGFIKNDNDVCDYVPTVGVVIDNNNIKFTTDKRRSYTAIAFKDDTELGLDQDDKYVERNDIFENSFSIEIPYSSQNGKKYTWQSDDISQNMYNHKIDDFTTVMDYQKTKKAKIKLKGVFFVNSPTLKDSKDFPEQYCALQERIWEWYGNSKDVAVNCQSLVFTLEPLSPKEVEQRNY